MVTSSLTFLASYECTTEGRSSQYCFVKWAGDRAVRPCTVSGEQAVGILQNQPKSGDTAVVAVGPGSSKLLLGGAVSPGGFIKTNHSGMGITATVGSFDYVMTMATERGGNGSKISVLINSVPVRSR